MYPKEVVARILEEDVLFTAEAGQVLGITPQAVHSLVHRKKLIPIRSSSGGHLFYRRDVEELLAKKTYLPQMTPREIIGGNITSRCKDYLNSLPVEIFDQVLGVAIFEHAFDAARSGYYTPVEPCSMQDKRMVATASPSFVMQLKSGEEIWLRGLNCGYGGTGPTGSVDILIEKLGVAPELANYVYSNSVIKYARLSDGTWEVSDAVENSAVTVGCPRCSFYLYEGRLILAMAVEPNQKTVDWSEYMPLISSYLMHPTSVAISNEEHSVAAGRVEFSSSGKRNIYQVVINDSIGNQLWIDIPVADNIHFTSQTNLASLFETLGLPKPIEPSESVKQYFFKKLFVRHNSAAQKDQRD